MNLRSTHNIPVSPGTAAHRSYGTHGSHKSYVPSSDDPKTVPPKTVTVRTMMGTRQVPLALKCLGSLKAFSRQPVRFVIHGDGTLTAADRDALTAALDPCFFLDRDSADALVADALRGRPRSQRFRRENLFGLKLFDVPLCGVAAGERRVVYCDTDILFTRPLECAGYFTGGAEPFVAMKDFSEAYAVRIADWNVLRANGVRLASRVCAGMMSLDPARVHDLDYIEWLLTLDEQHKLFAGFPFWAEQTIYAALAARAGAGWIDPAECVIAHPSTLARPTPPAVIHFAGLRRHLFDGIYAGMDPKSGSADRQRAPVRLTTRPAPVCHLGRRLVSAVKIKLDRAPRELVAK